MSTLLALYKNIMNNVSNDPESAATYTSQNLKKRLERHFANSIVFFQQGTTAAPDLVFSRDINIKVLSTWHLSAKKALRIYVQQMT